MECRRLTAVGGDASKLLCLNCTKHPQQINISFFCAFNGIESCETKVRQTAAVGKLCCVCLN